MKCRIIYFYKCKKNFKFGYEVRVEKFEIVDQCLRSPFFVNLQIYINLYYDIQKIDQLQPIRVSRV